MQNIPDILRKIASQEGKIKGMTKLEIVLENVFQFAMDGRPWAVQFIADRTEGKPHQSTSVHAEIIESDPLKDLTVDELRKIAGLDSPKGDAEPVSD